MANYYTSETIQKFRDALTEAKAEVKVGEVTAATISTKNIKMVAVPSVSLLPYITCPARCGKSCGKECYAAKIANLRASVLKSYARNTALLLERPELYWADVDRAMMATRFFRFHVGGDVPDSKYFRRAVAAVKANPHCQVLMFTKRWEIVNAWIRENGPLPENMHVLFSGWGSMKPVNPYRLPETNVYSKGEEPAPEWLLCGGNCFECGCRGVGCWQAKKGDVIAFKKH